MWTWLRWEPPAFFAKAIRIWPFCLMSMLSYGIGQLLMIFRSEHTHCVYQLQTIVKKKFQKRFRFFCVKHLLCENLVILVSWMHWKLVVVLYFNIQPSIVLKRGREFFFRVMFKMASWFGCEPPFFSFFSHCQTCQRHPKQVKSRKKHRRLKINNLRHKRRLCLHQLILMHFCKR